MQPESIIVKGNSLGDLKSLVVVSSDTYSPYPLAPLGLNKSQESLQTKTPAFKDILKISSFNI